MVTAADPKTTAHEVGLAIALHDRGAAMGALAGAKAANLARAAGAGLPVVPGFVITTRAAGWDYDELVRSEALRDAWRHLSGNGARPLVVRSSSVGEDVEASSMAGMFTSVLDVWGWDAFVEAVETVLESAHSAPLQREVQPMAVLVQRFIDAPVGGILFGLDPVSGRRDRIVVVAAEGPPDGLVGGRVSGVRYLLTRRGRATEVEGRGTHLTRRQRRALAKLARRAEIVFDGPQDVEWAIDGDLWLLQSRPVTAAAPLPRASGALLGPGPISETFPDPLAPLEQELWIQPLRTGLIRALEVIGTIPRKRIRSSDVVVTIGGRSAVNLELLGVAPRRKSWLARLDPRPSFRRLLASWRVGRLRACLPMLAEDLRTLVRQEVEVVPRLSDLPDGEVAALLRRTQDMLVCLHGQEILAGMLLTNADRAPTAASLALDALFRARAEGLAEEHIPAAFPETLVLCPPRIGGALRLPSAAQLPVLATEPSALAEAREGLRISERVVQELSARAALELGRRAVARGSLENADTVRWMSLSELETLAVDKQAPPNLSARAADPVSPPLPATFRLVADGTIVEAAVHFDEGGVGAGGGRGMGRLTKDPESLADGEVLVVPTLDPRLASALPHVAGLVAETGSVLSHLAILAREFDVPTVVSMPGACARLKEGSLVVVDGFTGEVSTIRGEAE